MVKKSAKVKAPKKPQSAFFMWKGSDKANNILKELNYGRNEYKKALKICGERWKMLSVEEKLPFQLKFKSLHEKWLADWAEYKQTSHYQSDIRLKREKRIEKKLKKLTRPKDPNAPKQPPSAYFEFSRQYRLENPDASFMDYARAIPEAWRVLEISEKKRILESSKEELKAYQRLMKEYKKTVEYKNFQEKLQEYKTNKMQILNSVIKRKKVINIRIKKPLNKCRRRSLKRLKTGRNRKIKKRGVSVVSLGKVARMNKRKKVAVSVVPLLDEEKTDSDCSLSF